MQPTPHEIARGVEFARRREAARLAHWRREAERTSGVYFSGGGEPYHPLTEEQIQAEGMGWARQWAALRAERAA